MTRREAEYAWHARETKTRRILAAREAVGTPVHRGRACASAENMSDITTTQLHNGSSEGYDRHKQKKAAREHEALAARRKKVFKKIGYWIVGLAVVIGSGWFLVSATSPKGPDYSQVIPVLGREHVANGTTVTSYNSNPPTSGNHYPTPAPPRFYDSELPDEQVVHNLEHGHVWIAYKPGLPEEIIKVLRKFSGGNVIVTPRSKNDADIALAAWGRLDKFNIGSGDIDKQRIKDFISRYQNRGPESISIQGHVR